MTTLTITQENFGKTIEKLYNLVSIKNETIFLKYETISELEKKENKNIINYLKSDSGKENLEKTEKLLDNILK